MNILCLVISFFLCSACPISGLQEVFSKLKNQEFPEFASVKTVYFDFGGVMARPDPQIQLNFLVERIGFPEKAVQDSLYLHWMQLHPAEIEYLTQKAKEYRIPLTSEVWEQYRKIKRSSVREIPGMSEVIKTLRDLNYKTYLISNIRSENLDLVEPFMDQFDGFIHCPKDPGERQEVWRIEWIRQGLNPSEMVLVDDQKPNIDEARNLGIQAIQFQNVETLLKELIDPLENSREASLDR